MKRIIFATGNQRKVQEATRTLGPLGISLSSHVVAIHEIQHTNPAVIAKQKARDAYSTLQQPVVVSDTSWSIPALSGFPGGYMKDISAWWQPEDWLQIMARHSDKTIYCNEHIAYFDGTELQHFQHAYTGHFIKGKHGGGNYPDVSSLEQVVCLYGDKTMAEMYDETGIASAGETLHHWQQFGEWYSSL